MDKQRTLKRKMESGARRILSGGILSLLFLFAGCPTTMSLGSKDEANQIPEMRMRDWQLLRDNVAAYNATHADVNARTITVVQNTFRSLVDGHSNDRIGDEALFYVGRIYYDIHDYHDARETFIRHQEAFPRSEFASTIDALEAEMQRTDTAYRNWVEASRNANSAGSAAPQK